MTKINYTVTVKTAGGQTITFEDGDTARGGSAAYAAITSGTDILAQATSGDDTVLTYIPLSSIDSATIEIASETVEAPEDANCNETNE